MAKTTRAQRRGDRFGLTLAQGCQKTDMGRGGVTWEQEKAGERRLMVNKQLERANDEEYK